MVRNKYASGAFKSWQRSLDRKDNKPALTKMRNHAAIEAISSFLAAGEITNEQLAREFGDWDAAKIFAKTGIAVRSIAADDECASDLGVAAATRLFESGRCRAGDIDFLLFCTQSPDYFMPRCGRFTEVIPPNPPPRIASRSST